MAIPCEPGFAGALVAANGVVTRRMGKVAVVCVLLAFIDIYRNRK